MANIQPITNLQNYDKVVSEVSYGNRVHLTIDGKSAVVLIDEDELDALECLVSKELLIKKLDKSKARAEKEGWISEEEVDRILEEV